MYKYYGAPGLAVWEGGSARPTPLDYRALVPSQAPQPVTCEVCKIYCTNPGGRRTHELGKKHKRNLKKLQESITSGPAKPPSGAVGTSTEPAAAVADSKIPAVQPKKNRQVLEAGAAQGELKTCMTSNVVKKQPVTCEVCKMQCTNPGGRRTHESGKKHKRNLKKLQESITSEPAKPPNDAVGASTETAVADGVIPAAQPKKNESSAASPEDPEVKNRGVLEAGAAQGELKTCTMSNVVKKEPVTCEVCKIQCPSLSILRNYHETGRKHKNNLKKLQGSITSEPAKPPNDAVGASTETDVAAVSDGVVPAVQPEKKNKRPAETPEDLEVKRRRVREHGSAEGEVKTCTMSNVVNKQPITCEVCKVHCRSLRLREHETGRKHKKNLKKLQGSITSEPAKPPNDAVGASTKTDVAAVSDGVVPAVQPEKKNKRPAETPEDLEVKRRRVREHGSAEGEVKTCKMSNVVNKQPITCEVCKILCHSLKELREHETGRKHKKNLKKLQGSITSEPAKPPNDDVGASTEPAAAAVSDGVVPAVQPEKKNKRPAETPEGLEVKRRRVREHGSAEGEDYELHIAGNGHQAKLQQQLLLVA